MQLTVISGYNRWIR